MKELKLEEMNEVIGNGSAAGGAGISCGAAILGASALFIGTGGLGALVAFNIGLIGCAGFGGAALT